MYIIVPCQVGVVSNVSILRNTFLFVYTYISKCAGCSYTYTCVSEHRHTYRGIQCQVCVVSNVSILRDTFLYTHTSRNVPAVCIRIYVYQNIDTCIQLYSAKWASFLKRNTRTAGTFWLICVYSQVGISNES